MHGDTIYFQDPGPGVYRPNYLRNNDFQNEYTFNPDDLLERAEKIYGVNTGLLGFALGTWGR